jgi:hypothetical protein
MRRPQAQRADLPGGPKNPTHASSSHFPLFWGLSRGGRGRRVLAGSVAASQLEREGGGAKAHIAPPVVARYTRARTSLSMPDRE